MKEKKVFTAALTGNPNSGKTSVFNALTGSNQHVGNWPGVTVEKKTGKLDFPDFSCEIVDLPGVYSLTSFSLDEQITRDFLLHEKPDLVISVVDASNLERNLYLVTQLLEMGVNVLVCLNMIDIAETKGIRIRRKTLESLLGVMVIPTVASQKSGTAKLSEAIKTAVSSPVSFRIDYGPDIESAITELSTSIPCPDSLTERFFFLKLLERDDYFLKLLPAKYHDRINSIVKTLEEETGEEPELLIAEKRYAFLHGLAHETTRKKSNFASRIDFTQKVDDIVLNRFFALPLFLLTMWLTFQLVFAIGGPLSDLLDTLMGMISDLTDGLLNGRVPDLFRSFIIDGIINGVGSIVVFVPNIFILFLAISILEDSGYMSRAAFVMDRFMHLLGLHGKSFIPMILGFGCSVPGIMACRTLETVKDRVITILVVPMMSCSAKLPIFTLFASAFFPGYEGTVVFSLYLSGIVLAVIFSKLFQSVFFTEETSPLIMELPVYHLPDWKGVLRFSGFRAGLFLKKAGTVILAGMLFIWLLASMPVGVEFASESSILGKMGSTVAPLFKPAGYGFWQAGASLIFGVMAKEVVVSTLSMLLHAEDSALGIALHDYFTNISALSFMVMCLIYVPCVATIAAVKQELGWKWASFAAFYTTLAGWIISILVYQIGTFFI